MRRVLLLLLLLSHMMLGGQPALRIFTTADGLVRNWIQRIRSDRQGNLWFCTAEGISVFDGSQFRSFTVRDGLPSRLVNDLIETSSGEYWVATDGGLCRFLPSAQPGRGHFERFVIGTRSDANRVQTLFEDSKHFLWLGTDEGLYRLRRNEGKLVFEAIPLGQGVEQPVLAIAEDSVRRIWAGQIDGVSYRSAEGMAGHLGKAQGVPMVVKALAVDGRKLWLGGEGLAQLDVLSDSPVVVARYSTANGKGLRISSLYGDPRNGDLWIGGLGLIRFHQQRFETFPSPSILANANILALGPDAASNLWAGVSTLGAVRLANNRNETYTEADGLESSTVVGVLEDRRGKIYAVTGAGHVLNELVGGRFVPRPRQVPAGLTDMGWGQGPVALQDRKGEWWVAAASGLLNYSATDDSRKLAHMRPRLYTRRDGCPEGAILRLFEDSRGDLWVGTSVGIAKRESANGQWTRYGSIREPVHAIAEDRFGAIWVGFGAPRLMRIRKGECAEIPVAGLSGFINALLADDQGRLWIGSSQSGLGRIDDPAAATPHIHHDAVAGLASMHVFALAEDRWGRLYVAGGRGIDRLDLATGVIRRLGEANGLPRGETERLYRDRSGSIWCASNFGLARIDTEAGKSSGVRAPTPRLRAARIGNAEFPLSALGTERLSGLEVAPNISNIEVEYRAVHFDTEERLRYQHRLGGASDVWSVPDEGQSIRFANLAPGDYALAVRSVSEDGSTSEPAVLEFRMLPPFWRRLWFQTLVFTAALAAAWMFHRYRLNQALILERMRTRLASDLHDDLGAGLAEIAILSEVGRRKAEQADDVMDQVAKRARGLRSTLGDIVWTVDPRKDRWPDLLQRMRETALTLLEDDARVVRFSAPGEAWLENAELTPDLRRHLLLFFKEAVTNIARHAGASEVDLSIAAAHGELRLSIRDNGRGFDTGVAAGGQGLRSLRFRAAEMRAELTIESTADRGTRIELQIPQRVRRLAKRSVV